MKTETQPKQKLILGTRGSPLALAQAHRVMNTCAHYFPQYKFEVRIIKTTGDKLQTASLAHKANAQGSDAALPPTAKGLFTKELEAALEDHSVDMAIHSLKDLPTDLPEGLILGGVLKRADVRDVLIYRSQLLADSLQSQMLEWVPGQTHSFRGFKRGLHIRDFPQGAVIATSSTRRQVQIQHLRPDIQIVPIRGNVATRIKKLRSNPAIDATLLAAAGLERLEYHLFPDGHFTVPVQDVAFAPELEGILGSPLELDEMLPCVGQAAIGIEIRKDDSTVNEICRRISNPHTSICVTAERSFLKAQGGGCQSPVAAYAKIIGHTLTLEAASFRITPPRRIQRAASLQDADALGQRVSDELKD